MSDTPPTPPPIISDSDPLVPLPPLPPDEETTQRVEVETEETRPFVKQDDAPPAEVILRPLEGELDPADELGFDRPLFVPAPPPPRPRPESPLAPEPLTPTDTREAADRNGYSKLVARTRGRKLKPTPPWPVEVPPPEVLFASAEHEALEEDEDTFDPVEEVETFDRTAEQEAREEQLRGELDFCPSPELVIQPPPLPAEATQQPGAAPPSVPGLVAHRDTDRTRLVLAAVAVLFAVALGILAGVLLRLVTDPVDSRTRDHARTAAPGAARPETRRPPLERRRPNLDGLRRQARHAATRDDHVAAYRGYGKILTHRPDDPAALLGYATSGVELGHEHVLFLLRRSMHRGLRRRAPVLGVRLAMVNGRWRRAERLVKALPRRARYSTRVMTWTAEIWHRLGRLESARPLFKRVLRDPRLRDRRVRVEALIGLSEVLLKRNYRTGSYKRARQARRIAAQLGSPVLNRRIERQIMRCQRALSR